MLTLVKTDDAVPIVGIYSGKTGSGKGSGRKRQQAKKPDETVYFTHETKKDNQNVASAAGVLHLHRSELKREFKLNESDFKEVCRMIDDDEEPVTSRVEPSAAPAPPPPPERAVPTKPPPAGAAANVVRDRRKNNNIDAAKKALEEALAL